MNLYNLFESPKLGGLDTALGIQTSQDQHTPSPIGSGTSKREAKKKPVTMMGVGVKEDINPSLELTEEELEEGWKSKVAGAALAGAAALGGSGAHAQTVPLPGPDQTYQVGTVPYSNNPGAALAYLMGVDQSGELQNMADPRLLRNISNAYQKLTAAGFNVNDFAGEYQAGFNDGKSHSTTQSFRQPSGGVPTGSSGVQILNRVLRGTTAGQIGNVISDVSSVRGRYIENKVNEKIAVLNSYLRQMNENSKKIKTKVKQPPESAQEVMYRHHQDIRKKSGLPDPSYYKELGAQKAKEIADMQNDLEEDILDRAGPKLPKPRNPAERVLRSKVNAAGKHTDKKKAMKQGVVKHKKPSMDMPEGVEQRQSFTNYDTWRSQVSAVSGIVHPQRDRNRLVAQSWDGETIGEFNLQTNQGWFGEQGVAEGKGDFAQAIDNLSGWHEEESDNPDIRIWVFDDREGGWYAQGTVYHNVKTGRVKIEFEDRADAWGGDVNDTFDSIGDAMKVLKNITGQISPNTGKAQDFDKLGGRTVAGPDDLYKTDRVGKKGTLNKTRMDIMKAFSPYRKTGPEGQLPESGVAEGKDNTPPGSYAWKLGYKRGMQDTTNNKPVGSPAYKDGWRAAKKQKQQGVAEGADDIASAKERLAYLEKIFDTSYEYSDDHSVWKKHNEIRQEMDRLKKIIGQGVDEGKISNALAGAALAGSMALGSPAHSTEPVQPPTAQQQEIITIAYVTINGETRKYNLGTKFKSSKEAEEFISNSLDQKGLSGYSLNIKRGYAAPANKETPESLEEDYDRYLMQLRHAGYEIVQEEWSQKYKRSINCSHPKGFSQKAHCAGKKKHNESIEMEMTCPDCGMCKTHGNMSEEKVRLDPKCWTGKKIGNPKTKVKGGVRVNNCVPK